MSEPVKNDDSPAMPEWAVELGLTADVFSLLVRKAFERGVPPVVVVREWIADMAAKMVA